MPNQDHAKDDASSGKPSNAACLECGKPIGAATPHGVCADCSLRNLLNDTFERTGDLGSHPLISHPEMDVTIDQQGHAKLVDPLSPGETIANFQVIRRLGRGGMGTVYEVQDLENQRRVALKVLNRPVEDEAARQRFLREGRLAASINHPNSVFVFGTHQLERHSLISMELVSGGTLEQRVRASGPLSSRDAVDVALQIVDGLQAAYDRGILHRDIKPANCFEANDGTVKVGDFGLSISTDPDFDSRVTSEGTLLGTPAFSSPEQLRGDALDVRSDIYALGVTLYYLLTGRTPYQADSLVKLLCQVFESSPKTPREIQSSVSPELSHVVMRCLAKEPGDRYRSYADLRTALQPLSSQVPEPATLGWRTIAGIVDWSAWGLLGLVYTAATSFPPEPIWDSTYITSRLGVVVFTAIYVVYFAICDSVFGQTPGKMLLGLKTVQLDGGRPTFPQALLRAAIYVLLPLLFVLPYNSLYRFGVSPDGPDSGWGLLVVMLIGTSRWGLLGLLFSTARRTNGMAGLHDLASNTRIVSSATESELRKVAQAALLKSDESVVGAIGPYQLLQSLSSGDGAEMHLAYDAVLLRRVWLRYENGGASKADRDRVSRATRLRWLNQFQDQEKTWDVYESPTGEPLLDRLRAQQTTPQELAKWTTDLVDELETAMSDGSVPGTLRTDQLWLTESNRLKVLEFSAPGIEYTTAHEHEDVGVARTNAADPAQRCRELLRTLAPDIRASLNPRSASALPPPLYVTKMLSRWEGDDAFGLVFRQTKEAARRRPISPRKRRLLMAAACYALPIAQIVFMVASQLQSEIFFAKHNDLRQLRALVNIVVETEHAKKPRKYEKMIAESPELEPKLGPDVEKYHRYIAASDMIAGNYSGVLEDPRMKTFTAAMHFHPVYRQKIAELQTSEHPTASDLAAAATLLDGPIQQQEAKLTSGLLAGYGATLMFSMITWVFYVALPAVFAGLIFRGGLVVHGFQTAIVRMNGTLAGRLKIFLRATLALIPGFVAAAILLLSRIPTEVFQYRLVDPVLVAVVVGLAISGAAISSLFGTRSIADRVLGTAVVSK